MGADLLGVGRRPLPQRCHPPLRLRLPHAELPLHVLVKLVVGEDATLCWPETLYVSTASSSQIERSKLNFLALKFLGSMASSGGRRSGEAVIAEAAESSAPMVK